MTQLKPIIDIIKEIKAQSELGGGTTSPIEISLGYYISINIFTSYRLAVNLYKMGSKNVVFDWKSTLQFSGTIHRNDIDWAIFQSKIYEISLMRFLFDCYCYITTNMRIAGITKLTHEQQYGVSYLYEDGKEVVCNLPHIESDVKAFSDKEFNYMKTDEIYYEFVGYYAGYYSPFNL